MKTVRTAVSVSKLYTANEWNDTTQGFHVTYKVWTTFNCF